MMRKIDTTENENEKVLIAFENIFFSNIQVVLPSSH